MHHVALLIGLFIVIECLVGLIAPQAFVGFVRTMQEPSLVYVVALIRFAFGAVLFVAAPSSRAPLALRLVGGTIALGGLLTPLIAAEFARVVLGWWSDGGEPVVRAWAAVGLALGAFIVCAVVLRPRAA